MGLNTRFEKANAATSTTDGVSGIAITWSSNEPTAGVSQTIADGAVPTVAELGQYVANVNAQLDNVVTQLNAVVADNASLRAAINAGERV